MPPRIRECQAKQSIMWRFSERTELATISEEIVQHQYRISSSITTRLVAQAVVTARREPCDSWSSGRLWSEGTPFQGHGETGSPASGDESMAGR
jgi:hypothetical protein